MADKGHEITDDVIKELEKKIQKEYKQANDEVQKKVDDYFARFAKKDAKKQAQLQAGLISQQEYNDWRYGQICVGERWKELKQNLAEDYVNANKIAKAMIDDKQADVYALNHNFATYQVEHDSLMDSSYTLYNRRTVQNLIKDEPNLLPYLNSNSPTAKKLKENADLIWNRQKVNSAITQGVLQGESIPQIAKRLEKVTNMNHSAAVRNARTMMTSCENKGRQDAYDSLREKGIDLAEKWIATLDGRTRHSHRHLHGTYKDPKTGLYENGLEYPGDPFGEPAEIYNCRCCEIAEVLGFKIDTPTTSPKLGDMTFDEWLNAKGDKQSLWWYKEPLQAEVSLSVPVIDIESVFNKHKDEIVFESYTIEDLYEYSKEDPEDALDFLIENLPTENVLKMSDISFIKADPEKVKEQLLIITGNLKENVTIKTNLYDQFQNLSLTESLKSMPSIDIAKQISKELSKASKELDIPIGTKAYWEKLLSGEIRNENVENLLKSLPIKEEVNVTSIIPKELWIDRCKNNPSISEMLAIENSSFSKMTDEEKAALRVYTGSAYDAMNTHLREIAVGKDSQSRYEKEIELCHNALDKVALESDMVLRRGTDRGDLAGLFMKGDFEKNMDSLYDKTAEELNEMFQGQIGTYFGFTSTSSQWDYGFSGDTEVVIYAPEGTAAASIMGISRYGTGEGETLLRDNTVVKCLGVEASDGHKGSNLRLFIEIIPDKK